MGVGAITSITEGQRQQPGLTDPFQMVNQAMALRQNMQTWNSQQEAGRILAASPDMDTAVATMSKSPNAAWMLPTINQMREIQHTEAQIGETQARTGQIGLNTAMDRMKTNILMNPNDPQGFMNGYDAMMQDMSPLELKENGKYMQSIHDSLLSGLPADGDKARKMFAQRVIALRLGAGMTPDAVFQSYGVPAASYGEVPADPVTGAPGMGVRGGMNSLFGPSGSGGGAGGGDASGGAVVGPGGQPMGGNALGGGISNVTRGPTVTQSQRLKAGETLQEEMTQTGMDAPHLLNNMDTLYNTLKGFRAGGGADWRENIASKVLQAAANLDIPVPQSLIDLMGNRSLSDTQVFTGIAKQFATGLMRDAVQGTGAGRLKIEAEAFLQQMSAANDPQAIIDIMNNEKKNIRMHLDQADQWPKFNQMLTEGKDPTVAGKGYVAADFPTWWGENRRDQLLKNFAGYSLEPFTGEGVKGSRADQQKEAQSTKAGSDYYLTHDQMTLPGTQGRPDTHWQYIGPPSKDPKIRGNPANWKQI